MPEATQPTEQPHRNHGLFSDHYLDVTLPERPGWEELIERSRTVMEEISSVYFRAEVKKVFKKDIPLAERDEWEEWLAGRRVEHERLTAEIVRLETDPNTRVYDLFDLTPEEIRNIEESTKYRYGEV